MKYRTFTRAVFCLAVILALATGATSEAQAQANEAAHHNYCLGSRPLSGNDL